MDPEPTRPEKEKGTTFWRVPYLELCAVLVIGGFLVFLTIPTISDHGDSPGRSETRVLVSSIRCACDNYQTEYNVLPQSPENHRLAEILTGKNPRGIEFITLQPKYVNANKEMIDAYGTPLRITFPSDKSPLVVSAGKDLIFDTKDDIRTDK